MKNQVTSTQWNKSYDQMVLSGIVSENQRSQMFKRAISKGAIKLGRGAYTEAQTIMAKRFEEFKESVYKELKEKKVQGFTDGEVLNLAGDIVRPSLNMKAEKK
tara:strand:+ start:603 stop:911 length:309 start_codon:yes stop_codon:yes gene_type:complete